MSVAGGAVTPCGRHTIRVTPPTRSASSPAPSVGDLLNRFEKAAADELVAGGVEAVSVASRRHAEIAPGLLGIVLAAPDVNWASRMTKNPVARLGDPA